MDRLFLLQEKCLRLMGHSPNLNKESLLHLKYIVPLLILISTEYPLITHIYANTDDMELITATLSILFNNTLTLTKILTFMNYKEEFWKMIMSFRQMYENCIDRKLKDYNYVMRANTLASRLSRAYWISCSCTALYFMLGPILKIIASKIQGVSHIRELPMPLKFPFNSVNSPGYEIGFFYTVIFTTIVVVYASAIDGLFISFAINLRGHFQTLQHEIRNVDYKDYKECEEKLKRCLPSIVEYHVKLLNLSKKLCLIYMPIVFGQFLMTSLQVGVIMYQLSTNMNSIMALLVYLSFFGSIMLQLFIYCYGGEIILNESLEVGVAIQLSNWDLAIPNQRRLLVLIMLRSQKEVLIKAGFYKASLANFLAICRAAMSIITALKAFE